MQDSTHYIYTAIVASTIAFLLLFSFFLGALHKWRMQKLKQIENDKLISSVYEFKISESEILAQETTLNFVGKELHDKVGLTLTLAKLNLNSTLTNLPEGLSVQFANVEKTLSEAIVELKEISMGLNSDIVNEYGLIHSIENEVSRINRSTNKQVEYDIIGKSFHLNNDQTIAIIRVIQELLNNIIKYSDATKITILVSYYDEYLEIEIIDNGGPIHIPNYNTNSSGLINIKHRLKLLGSKLEHSRLINENRTCFKINKNEHH